MASDQPLVSVGIPTFNRLAGLRAAVESVLAQDYPAIEIIICDNASDDGTEEYGREVARRHANVTYLRNDTNIGPTGNFNRARAESTGEFLAWLGDDDWYGPGYVRACVECLERHPEAALATGRIAYEGDDGYLFDGVTVVCDQPTGPERVASYYRQVRDNGTFYGVARRSVIEGVPPKLNRMGNDWYLLAAEAFQGPILLVDGAVVHRRVGGATRSLKHVAQTFHFTWFEGEFPQVAIAGLALRDIGWHSPVYAPAGRVGRLALGVRCATIVVRRFVLPNVPRYLRQLVARVRPGHG
jgi:glycosyltransferase involved in cell wall biosynthesis